MNVLRSAIVASALLLLSACNRQVAEPAGAVHCETPRPQMCTREYRPVCGARDTGVRCVTEPCPSVEMKTYGNACDACSDEQVVYYIEGACGERPAND